MVTQPSRVVAEEVKRPWVELPEALLLLGISFLVSGVWLIYPPAALILFGLICVIASLNIYGYFRRDREKK
jgi:hypothetical protein